MAHVNTKNTTRKEERVPMFMTCIIGDMRCYEKQGTFSTLYTFQSVSNPSYVLQTSDLKTAWLRQNVMLETMFAVHKEQWQAIKTGMPFITCTIDAGGDCIRCYVRNGIYTFMSCITGEILLDTTCIGEALVKQAQLLKVAFYEHRAGEKLHMWHIHSIINGEAYDEVVTAYDIADVCSKISVSKAVAITRIH